jgi:hypothetical protein
MDRLSFTLGVVALFCVASLAWSQDPGEVSRQICDPATEPDICIEDTIEVVFDGDSQSVLELAEDTTFPLDLEVTIVTDTKTGLVQGWSYGVLSDDALLTVNSVTIEGTEAEPSLTGGFNATSNEDIETCDVVPDCPNRTEGGGWLSAIVLNFITLVELPIKRNPIAIAQYSLSQMPAPSTTIEISSNLAKKKSPPTEVNVTVNGESKRWTTAVDGLIKGEIDDGTPFLRGDIGMGKPGEDHPADEIYNITDAVRILRTLYVDTELVFDCASAADVNDDGSLNETDAVYLMNYMYIGGPQPPAPFGAIGTDPTPDDLECTAYP